MGDAVLQGCRSRGGGGGGLPWAPRYWPISLTSTRGAYYAHHIKTRTRIFIPFYGPVVRLAISCYNTIINRYQQRLIYFSPIVLLVPTCNCLISCPLLINLRPNHFLFVFHKGLLVYQDSFEQHPLIHQHPLQKLFEIQQIVSVLQH